MVYGHLGEYEWTRRTGVQPFAVSCYFGSSVLYPPGKLVKRQLVVYWDPWRSVVKM
jgi:hypothetical protein